MADLIVGFPQHEGSATSRSRRRAERSIRFSPMSELVFYERADEKDHGDIWFNSKDYAAMRANNKEAVIEIHRRCKDEGDEAFTGCETTGLEGLLTPGLIRSCHKARMACVNAVLDEQDRQEDMREQDMDKLAKISRHFSSSAARRAHKIGVLQSR